MSSARVRITPREAAALDRLIYMYGITVEDDPGAPDLWSFREKIRRIEQDHAAYEPPDASHQGAAAPSGDSLA